MRSTARNGEARGWSSGRRRPPRGRAAFSPVSASSGSSAASAPPVSREPRSRNYFIFMMLTIVRILYEDSMGILCAIKRRKLAMTWLTWAINLSNSTFFLHYFYADRIVNLFCRSTYKKEIKLDCRLSKERRLSKTINCTVSNSAGSINQLSLSKFDRGFHLLIPRLKAVGRV